MEMISDHIHMSGQDAVKHIVVTCLWLFLHVIIPRHQFPGDHKTISFPLSVCVSLACCLFHQYLMTDLLSHLVCLHI